MSDTNGTASDTAAWIVAFNGFQTVIIVLGLFGNIVFFASTIKKPLGLSFTLFLLRCQSILDGCVCFTTIVITYQSKFWLVGYKSLDAFICHFWHSQFVYWYFVFLSVQNLLLIAFDRFFAVIMPLMYRTGNQKRRKICCVLFLAIYSGIIVPPASLQARYNATTGECTGEYVNDKAVTSRFFYAYSIIWFMTCFFIPTVMFCTLYGKVLHVLFQPTVISKTENAVSSRQNFARSFTIVTSIVTSVFIFSLSFDSIYYLLGYIGVTTYSVNTPLQIIGVFLVSFNSCANPYVYIILFRPFRQAIKQTLMFWTSSDTTSNDIV